MKLTTTLGLLELHGFPEYFFIMIKQYFNFVDPLYPDISDYREINLLTILDATDITGFCHSLYAIKQKGIQVKQMLYDLSMTIHKISQAHFPKSLFVEVIKLPEPIEDSNINPIEQTVKQTIEFAWYVAECTSEGDKVYENRMKDKILRAIKQYLTWE